MATVGVKGLNQFTGGHCQWCSYSLALSHGQTCYCVEWWQTVTSITVQYNNWTLYFTHGR